MSSASVLASVTAANYMGINEGDLVPAARSILLNDPLCFRTVTVDERDNILSDVVRGLARRDFPVVGAERKAVWERGWSENLKEFIAKDFDINALRPRFMRKNRPFRLAGEYIVAEDGDFEFQMSCFIRLQLFGSYFKDVERIFEFGAGTGLNILELQRQFPDKDLIGLDWTQASIEIMAHLHEHLSPRISGRLFDFFAPNTTLELAAGSGVLTSGALEQIGDKFEPFLDFLLAQRPSIVVHLEPILELYDETRLFDVVAAEYHRQRNYLHGYLPRLRELADAGRIKLIAAQRTGFGTLYNEGYSFVVWQPL